MPPPPSSPSSATGRANSVSTPSPRRRSQTTRVPVTTEPHQPILPTLPASPQVSVDFFEYPNYDEHEHEHEKPSSYLQHHDPSPPHSRSSSTAVAPPSSWSQQLSKTARRTRRSGWLSRRALLAYTLVVSLVLAVSNVVRGHKAMSIPTMPAKDETTKYVEAMMGAPGKLKNAMSDLVRWEAHDKEVYYEALDKTLVVNFAEPQERLSLQLKDGIRYVTGLAYGGHANQFISIGRLLYYAKITNRVAIIPTLLPVHFSGAPANMSDFFDLARFWHESKIPSIEMSSIRPLSPPETDVDEPIACWSVQEATAGYPNLYANSVDIHGIWVNYWPLPAMAKALGGHDLAFDALRVFDFDTWWRQDWINKAKREFLPQKPVEGGGEFVGDKSKNVKDGFPLKGPEPTDQLMCFDNTLFTGPIMFPESFPGEIPLESTVPGEGLSWKEAMRYMYFNQDVEDHVDRYLMKIFNVRSPSKIPPFISVHLRRGDFKEFAGLTALEKYEKAVERVRDKLQKRLDDGPRTWRGPGKRFFRNWGIKASDYQVLTTTDEPTGSAFIEEVRALGWKVLDHGEEKTEEVLGGWWPTILDAAVLARGQSFVGTQHSTFSHLAGLRVKYWRGGLVDAAS
ncbi:GDP-fucose protein O-fucosyltransferase [Pseudohyphozyma bogoriensis]|nr:GDP-fucose protein O-fucosyltransferase [Pseudohyphozyma bogoriensis]